MRDLRLARPVPRRAVAPLRHRLGDPLAAPRAARRARPARRRDALARGRRLPGGVPQPARRPVPARSCCRSRARRDDRDRLPAARRRARTTCCRSRRSPVRRSASRSPIRSARSADGGRNPAALVLAGVTVVAFLTAVQTFIQQQHAQTAAGDLQLDPRQRRHRGLALGRARTAVRRGRRRSWC